MKHASITNPIVLYPRQIASWFQSEVCVVDLPPPIIASVPTLQRGLVWHPAQIELLWDSLLRGFPVGSIVVCQRIPGQDDGDDSAVTHHLLDGQQRTHAISLGFDDPFAAAYASTNPPTPSILWIDLFPEISSNSTREFMVRLTTSAHPWGFSRADSCDGMRASEIRNILKGVALDPSSPDYVKPNPADLFPAEAAVPIPMAWLTRQDSIHADAFWSGILDRCERTETLWSAKVSEFLSDHSDAAKKARQGLFDALRRFHGSQIIALPAPDSLVHATRGETSRPPVMLENSAIEHLFQRLNRQGTRLDGEELAYSMIKAYWPQVARPIREMIVRRMPASRLVMMAARAALTPPGASQLRGPLSVSDIRRLATDRDEDATRVVDFIEHRLRPCCEWIENAMLFDPQSHPNGLLPVHLANIARSHPDVYLLLLCLADRCLSDPNSESMESLRPTLFALVCRMAWFASDSHLTAHQVLAVCNGTVSTELIRQAMDHAEKEGWLLKLPDPDHVSFFLDIDDHDIESWSWYTPIHGDGEQPGVDLRQRRWGGFLQCLGNKDLLLYAQREFIARKFPDFDPSRRDLWEGHNRPWDFDHLHAKALVHNKKADNRYQHFLKQWLDTIGNLRAWPFEDNRSDSDTPADAKIVTSAQLTDSFLTDCELPAFSMGRKPLSDETAAREFGKACRDRMIRIYEQCWNQIR